MEPIDDTQEEIYAPDGFGGNAYDASTGRFSDTWIADQEAAYQESLRTSEGAPVPVGDALGHQGPASPRTNSTEAGILGFGDTATFGFLDEAGAVADTILGGNERTIWDGSSFSDAYRDNLASNREKLDAAQDQEPWSYGAGGVAGALVPIGGAIRAAKSASLLKKLGASAATGAAYGGAYGFGSDEGEVSERLDGALGGAAVGAAGGASLHGAAKAGQAVLSPVARRLFPDLSQALFARSQSSNPHVVADAEVAKDLDKLVQTMLVDSAERKLSMSQRATLLGRIDELEASYLPVKELKAMDLPPSVKSRLQSAMAKRHLLSDSEVSALRDGTPAGDAVADAIEKSRRLRAYVPEGRNGSGGRLSDTLGDAIGSAAGWKLGGPLGGAVGGSMGRSMMSWLSARQARNKAVSLAKEAPRFEKLPQVQAARAEREGATDLTRMATDALDAPYYAQKAAQRETELLTNEGRQVSIANARDDIRPSGGWRGTIYERTGLLPSQQDAGALKALTDGAISPSQFQAYLDDPAKLMKGNAGNALIDRLASMADKGVLKRDADWTPPVSNSPQGARAVSVPVTRQGPWETLSDVPQDVRDAASAEFFKANPGATAETFVSEGQFVVRQDPAYEAIRNPLAYEATAKANQQRVTDTLSSVRGDNSLPVAAKETLASAIASIGNTSSRTEAQAIATDALDRLSDDHREYGRSLLSPLVQQIRN
ncbi:hypothetical protein [Novosphingobium marinum]|uniref:Uncharacterized protein n=1 Tax=Novosphingobium marinum TaxID=1514948 RepID=A0A7Y9XU32_9SPHN|nr:hypothetical protein [Novosphingobium marinum]NYH94616.1 hypothetical protein [Novosphingobium marinum]